MEPFPHLMELNRYLARNIHPNQDSCGLGVSGSAQLLHNALIEARHCSLNLCAPIAVDRYPLTDLDFLNLTGTLPDTQPRWYGGPPSIAVFPSTPEPSTLGPNPPISSIEPPTPFNHTTPSAASFDSGQKNILLYSPTSASHFQHDPEKAHLGHDHNSCLSKPKPDNDRPETTPTLLETQRSDQNNQLGLNTNEATTKKGKRVMFSEAKHHSSQLEQGVTAEPSDTGHRKQIIEKSSASNLNGNVTNASYQNYPQEIAGDSEDDFNYDDPIIIELLDKDWDKELEIHKRSPKDKAAQFDINSSIIRDNTRPLFKGDTSANRTTGIQDTYNTSEEEEETTPIYNRFHTLQNLEEEETPPPELHTQINTEAVIQVHEQGDKAQQEKEKSFEISQASTHNYLQE
ncbi:hypothetical protein Salat_1873300 [Sesamum alatum]|uniref:Uncharacterized protein n=1 Tax=Sesamum alatum TaxID=300844 RepID=A0AAE1Y420_9LAMI|nr:hypothetical protein Salat_1873300 [Sesamum alatum]